MAAEFGEDEQALALGGVRNFEGAVEDATGDLVGRTLREEEALRVLVEIGVGGVFVFRVVHVSFIVVVLKESAEGGKIAGGGATDDGLG